MFTHVECLPCLSQAAVETAQLATINETDRCAGVGEALLHLAMVDPEVPLPFLAEDIQQVICRHAGNADPYRDSRRRLNIAASTMVHQLERMIRESKDPFLAALRVAVAGNLIEGEAILEQAGLSLNQAWQAATRGAFGIDHSARLRSAVQDAKHVVYMADNAGEILWDRLFIERLPVGQITVIVRKTPYSIDALGADALFAGFDPKIQIVASSYLIPGANTKEQSAGFNDVCSTADLIIAKGAAHYLTLLSFSPHPRFFCLLAPRCPQIAKRLDVKPDTLVVFEAAKDS